MDVYSSAYLFFTIAVLFGYINHRFVKLQTTIAIMASSLIVSLALLIAGHLGLDHFEQQVQTLLERVDFHGVLMNGMLSFLLFAGALHIDLNHLRKQKWEIGVLATLSTICSAIIIAFAINTTLGWLGTPLNYTYCLLFGALISPTDPIAVLATFKQLNAPKQLDISVAGESLFNDGVGIVMFLSIYSLAFSGHTLTISNVAWLFFTQAIGGVAYGVLLGLLANWLIKPIDDHKIEILITLVVATGGYAFAEFLNVSGPLAMVAAGIFIGNRGRNFSMSEQSRQSLDMFWELIDEILNAVLFLLIGFELLVVQANMKQLTAALLAIPITLLARLITVGIPMNIFKIWKRYAPKTISIMVWGGLRGGLAVALALALPAGPERNLVLVMTYAVVTFAVIVQGLSVKSLVEQSKASTTG